MAYASWSVIAGEQPTASKWNILGTNDAHFYSFLGDNTAWQSWTPTLTNWTLGNGTVTAKYIQIGKTVFFRFTFLFGSTSSISANHTVTLPVTASSNYSLNLFQFGVGTVFDTSAGAYYDITGGLISTTTMRLFAIVASGTYGQLGQVNSTSPITFATGDEVMVQGCYEAA